MADDYGLNLARATLGQGLGMGWGDELEALARAKAGQGTYEGNLAKIRGEYGKWAAEHPYVSGGAEFGGGFIPGAAMMLLPGGQPAGAAQLQRSTLGALTKYGLMGAGTGAVSGAGSAKEGERLPGATSGAITGGIAGVAIPTLMKAGTATVKWGKEHFFPTQATAEKRSLEKMLQALEESGMQPKDINKIMRTDRALRAPSTVANVGEAVTDLAEAVAQRSGKAARTIEKSLTSQKLGSRERTYQHTVKGLKPGDYYADEQRMVSDLRQKAGSVYDQAYAHGTVDDPTINEVLKNPAFKGFYDKAREIADTEALAAKVAGEDPSKYQLKDIYKIIRDDTGAPVGVEMSQLPDVRTLDYIKRGIDATIDNLYSTGKSAEATALKKLRGQFITKLDDLVPDYKNARKEYAGDIEVIEAMRRGMKDFGKLDHEQIIGEVAKMSDAEKQAFRTGVARDLYSRIMDPSTNFNAAQRIIGSPEMQAKLQPLFDSPKEFRLFKAALERESQLFHQANRILGGSQTAKRTQMREKLEEGPGVGGAIADAVSGGFWNSLTNMATQAIRKGQMGEETANKLATMLTSKNPKEVAAVVKSLENYAAGQAPKAQRMRATEAGAATGTAAAINPAPAAPGAPADIEKDLPSLPAVEVLSGPDIEADLESESAQ